MYDEEIGSVLYY